jgi:hypothetical protein
MKSLFAKLLKKASTRGFVLPLTLVICVIILTISSGISIILAKELYFSRLSRLSQVAYYAGDDGMMCATMIDDGYIDPDTGLGIFQYTNSITPQSVLDKINANRAASGLPVLALNSIKCATSDIFNASQSGYAAGPAVPAQTDASGNPMYTTSYSMSMDLGDGTQRCAQVTINKTSKYRQIISRGFASCLTTSVYRIERAIVSTTEVQ